MIRIAGVTVLYNPEIGVLENIGSYLGQIESLYAIDNSERPDPMVVENIRRIRKVSYIWNGGNLGVATALNIGAKLATEQRFDFLLMMDQDSIASSNLVSGFERYVANNSSGNIGILSPYHSYRNYERAKDPAKVQEAFLTITSGTLLNLAAYRKVGPFIDEFFIDYVDFEYCLRLHVNGFRIVQLNDTMLYHQLGATEARKIFFRRVAVYNYPPERQYYKFRNRLFVVRKYFTTYPVWALNELRTTINELIKIILFEKDKFIKCKMAFVGIVHFFLNRHGKLK